MDKLNNSGEQTRQKILAVIVEYIGAHGYSPSTREICKGVGLASTSSVNNHLRKMFDAGMIETDAEVGAPRAIRVPGYKFVKVEEE